MMPPEPVRDQDRGTRRAEMGAAAVELTLFTPLLVLLLLFIVTAGRLTDANLQVNAAAHQAARAASIARTPGSGAEEATATAKAALTGEEIACKTIVVSIDTSNFRRGGTVSVTVSCTVALGDLAFPGVPGSHTVSARSTEPLDVHRGVGR